MIWPCSRPESPEVDLDADLEQQQHHADVGEQLELLAVGDVAGREGRDGEAESEVADNRRQPETPRQPAGGDGRNEERAELEDRRRAFHLHAFGDGHAPNLGEPSRPAPPH